MLLLPRLRWRARVVGVRRGYVRLYAVDCSDSQFSEICAVTVDELLRLRRALQTYTGAGSNCRRLRVLCFGGSATFARAPELLTRRLDSRLGRGVWIRGLRAAVVLFDGTIPVRRIIIHELTHAFVDLFTEGYRYPLAVEEGFARAMEYLLRPDPVPGTMVTCVGGQEWESQRYLSPSECLSVRELLFDPKRYWDKRSGALAQMTNLSFWPNVYLAKLSHERPILRMILRELRMRGIRTPEGVYQWLLNTSGMNEHDFEKGLRQFCTTGRMPEQGHGDCGGFR